jgi:hypothetical protein
MTLIAWFLVASIATNLLLGCLAWLLLAEWHPDDHSVEVEYVGPAPEPLGPRWEMKP